MELQNRWKQSFCLEKGLNSIITLNNKKQLLFFQRPTQHNVRYMLESSQSSHTRTRTAKPKHMQIEADKTKKMMTNIIRLQVPLLFSPLIVLFKPIPILPSQVLHHAPTSQQQARKLPRPKAQIPRRQRPYSFLERLWHVFVVILLVPQRS